MEKILPTSTWNLPPTEWQVGAITRLCIQKKIKEHLEHKPSNRWEARNLIYELRRLPYAKPSTKISTRGYEK